MMSTPDLFNVVVVVVLYMAFPFATLGLTCNSYRGLVMLVMHSESIAQCQFKCVWVKIL